MTDHTKDLELYGSLVREAMGMLPKAYVPYSHFNVAAALLCSDGSVFKGVNIENAAYGAGICAERTAIFKAVSEGKKDIDAIAVVGCASPWLLTEEYKEGRLPDYCPPCGICRQVMREFADPESFKIILAVSPEDLKVYKLSEMLLDSFGPDNLSK